MKEALDIINYKPGFMVRFSRLGKIDHFPDKSSGDELIQSEEEAWELARKFAANMRGRAVTIYVVDQDFKPVEGYEQKFLSNR